MAGLVDLLRGEEVLLLLERRGVDVRRERVGDGVLAVEEQREDPHRAAALLGRHPLVPVDPVLREVDLGRAPVAPLPARVEVLRSDLLRRSRDRMALMAGRYWPTGQTGVTASAQSSFGERHGASKRRTSSSGSSSIATRSCSSESRSRTVTVRSSSDWWSTVTQHGVPISSWRR